MTEPADPTVLPEDRPEWAHLPPPARRALAEAGASFLTVPSAFTRKTGEAHWHTLLRARAIETGCFVFAAAQAGLHENKRETFGHSLIIDPWGEILAEGDYATVSADPRVRTAYMGSEA